MEFLPRLGKKGWPKEVWYRVSGVMLQCYLSAEGVPPIQEVDAATLNDVFSYTQPYNGIKNIEEMPLLLLDLMGHEAHPKSHIPIYTPLSNRDVYGLTSAIEKSQGNYLLVDPPTCEDMQVMAWMESKLSSMSVFHGMSSENIKQTVIERVNIVGPNVREVFVSEDWFEGSKRKLMGDVRCLSKDIEQVTISDFPSKSEEFMGAFVVPGTFIPSIRSTAPDQPDDWYSVRFLSDFIAKAFAQSCSKHQKKKLVASRYNYLVAEAIIGHGLTTLKEPEFMDEPWFYEDWVFYSDTGGEAKLSNKDKIERPVFPLCEKQEYFGSIYLNRSVSLLEARTLYRSTAPDRAICGAMLVCHPTGSEKEKRGVVYAFQSRKSESNSYVDRNSLEYSTVKEVMDKLNFLENDKYDICYVYCSDASNESETGYTLTNKRNLSLEETQFVDGRLTIIVARVSNYPKVLEVI